MNLHFACTPASQHINVLAEEKAKNLLFSYAFIKKPERLAELLKEMPQRIILDSGAFSVWSNGGTIDIDSYAAFATEFQKLIPSSTKLFVVNLDVLPGKWGFVPTQEEIALSAEQGWKNMEYLESKGLKVIHVFHQHEDFAILDRLAAHSDYIGISPANDVSMNEKMAWMNIAFKQLGGVKIKTKCHGFAVTSPLQMFNLPFYSVDSSSWVAPARFGRVPVLTDNFTMKTFAYKDVLAVEDLWKYVAKMGIEKIAAPKWEDRVRIAIRTYQKLEAVATDIWTRRGVVWND